MEVRTAQVTWLSKLSIVLSTLLHCNHNARHTIVPFRERSQRRIEQIKCLIIMTDKSDWHKLMCNASGYEQVPLWRRLAAIGGVRGGTQCDTVDAFAVVRATVGVVQQLPGEEIHKRGVGLSC